MPGGRPTSYNEEIIKKAQDYLENLPEGEIIHTIEGLALYLGVDRTTIYDWARQDTKTEFSHIVKGILTKQGMTLLNGGLQGVLNPKIAALILSSKHGYVEKQEVETKNITLIGSLLKQIENANVESTESPRQELPAAPVLLDKGQATEEGVVQKESRPKRVRRAKAQPEHNS